MVYLPHIGNPDKEILIFILGLAGSAGVGKDTVADYLVKAYGFVKFAFSDALYQEVQDAYGLKDQTLLRDRATKEKPAVELRYGHCDEHQFNLLLHSMGVDASEDLSPRQVLQWWGTEYRRAQDPHYWLHKNEDWLCSVQAAYQYPEHAPQHYVNTTVRFENEREWIHTGGFDHLWVGNVWHIHRQSAAPVAAHASETPLLVWPDKEREIYNNDSVERLHRAVDLLMQTQARFVKVMPMAPNTEPA